MVINSFVNVTLLHEVYMKMFYKYKKRKKVYRLFNALYDFKKFQFFSQKEITETLKRLKFKSVT